MSIQLRVEFPALPAVRSKAMRFNLEASVSDACSLIRSHIPEVAALGSHSDYGLHVWDDSEGTRRRFWLEDERPLSFYKNLRPMSSLEYRKKTRPLRVKMMDGAVKTIIANDAAPVNTIIQQICERVGITNWESYSLVIDDNEDEKLKTIQRRESSAFRNARQMEKLRSMLHTDDGVNWVNHDKSLSEQGITEDMVLTLRVKFWGDSNIDRQDPVHLNLIFAEARDSITQGTHPVTEEEAVLFAAIHAQEQFGSYDAARGKSLQSYLKELLPPDYRKVRGIDQRVITEYSKLAGLSEHNARFRYVDLFRSLKTFGVSFFLVKEKQAGKNRLVPSLLGISRDSILRVDAKTKKILKVWPLTRVKDWAASPKAFTLSFGDHTDSAYSVQTLEGETISQRIGGYVDILLKKRQELEGRQIDDASSEVVAAESIMPGHATVVLPGGAGQLGQVGNQLSTNQTAAGGDSSQMLSPEESRLSESIHSVLTQIGTFLPEIQRIMEDRALADDMDMASWHDGKFELHRQQLLNLVSNITAATAQLVLLTAVDPADINLAAVDSSVAQITSSMDRLVDTVKTIAYHLPDDLDLREKMLDAVRNLMSSTSNMLTPLLPELQGDRGQLVQSVNELGLAAGNLLGMFGDVCCSQAYQDELLALAYLVALASRSLGKEVGHVAVECDDTVLKKAVAKDARATFESGGELVICTKAVSSCLPAESARVALVTAAGHVKEKAEQALNSSEQASYDANLLGRIARESASLDRAIEAFLAKLNEGPRFAQRNTNGELCEAILAALDNLRLTVGTSAVLKDMAVAGKAVSRLVTGLRDQAQGLDDPALSQRLMDSARLLTEATARLLDNVKRNTQDPSNEGAVQESIEDVKEVVWAVAGDDYRRLLLERLEVAARRACATSTQLSATSTGVNDENPGGAEREQLTEACRDVDDEVGALGAALKNLAYNPERAQAQLRLLTTAPGLLQPGTQLVVTAKGAHGLVERDDLASDLLAVLKTVARSLGDLKAAIKAFSEVAGLLNLDAAMETVKDLVELVEEDVDGIRKNDWQRDSGETLQSATALLTEDARSVGSALAKVVSAAAQRDDVATGEAAQAVAEALTELVESSRSVAACCPTDRAGQELLLTAVSSCLTTTIGLLHAGRETVTGAGGTDSKQDLVTAAKAVQEALAGILNSLPHVRRMDAAIDRLAVSNVVSDVVRSFQDAQNNFSDRAGALNQAVANLLEAARTGDMSLAEAAQRLAEDFLNMLSAAKGMDDASKSENAMLMAHAQGISEAAARLLEASRKLMVSGLDSPDLMASLAAAARGVTDSMNSLLGLALAAPPGQKECESAERAIVTTGDVLLLSGQPSVPDDYFHCQRVIQDKAMALNSAMNGINSSLRANKGEEVQVAAPQFGADMTAITRAAAKCSLLIGAASPFSAPLYAIRVACCQLQDSTCEGRQLLAQATEINTQSAVVRKIAMEYAERAHQPNVKRFYMAAAKETTGLTAAVVQSVTKLASDCCDDNRSACSSPCDALTSAIEELVAYSLQPPGTDPPAAGQSQVPVLSPARSLVQSGAQYMHSAAALCKDASSDVDWKALGAQGREVSNALRRLLEDVLTGSPGQRECDTVLDDLKEQLSNVDQALVGAVSRNLKPAKDSSLEAYHEQVMGALIDVHEGIEPLVAAARSNPVALAQKVTKAGSPFNRLCPDVVGAASHIVDAKSQVVVLECGKALLESMMQLVESAKKSGGNPEARQSHASMTSAASATRSSIQKLSAEMEAAASSSGAVTSLVEGVEQAMMMLDQPLMNSPAGTFQEYAEAVAQSARIMTGDSQKLISKSSSQPQVLPDVMASLVDEYRNLAANSQCAIAVAEDEQIALSVMRTSKALGQSSTRLLLAGAAVHSDPSDLNAKRGLAAAARALSEKVSNLLSALQAGSRGAEACAAAMQELSGIISEVETNIYFVSAGTLLPDGDNDVFSAHRDKMLGQTKALIDHVKQLVLGAATSSERLAAEAAAIVATTRDLAEATRGGAAALGNGDRGSQTGLLEACKGVASSLSDLLSASKDASGRPPVAPEMETLRLQAKSIMQSIGHYMGTVKTCDGESARGTHALQGTSNRISEEIRALYSPASPGRTASADDLIRSSKLITHATAKLQLAGRSKKREDAMVAADVVSRSVVDMLTTCRAASESADTHEGQQHCLLAGQQCGEAFVAMLQHVISILTSPTPEKSRELPQFSKNIAMSVNGLVKAAELLKSGYVNPDDPNVIAERELRAAAASIEAASRKLAELKPRESARMADESLTFDEQILEAAKAITLATSALIKWATATQRELASQGRVNVSSSQSYISSEDSTWSQGLVSAAKMVAETTSQLCDAANLLVQGQAKEEKLIAAAKGVSQWTIQLLMACQVKADVDSESAVQLQDAGRAVERASANLVRVATDAANNGGIGEEATGPGMDMPVSAVQRIKIELELREKIGEQERALAAKRAELEGLHKQAYSKSKRR